VRGRSGRGLIATSTGRPGRRDYEVQRRPEHEARGEEDPDDREHAAGGVHRETAAEEERGQDGDEHEGEVRDGLPGEAPTVDLVEERASGGGGDDRADRERRAAVGSLALVEEVCADRGHHDERDPAEERGAEEQAGTGRGRRRPVGSCVWHASPSSDQPTTDAAPAPLPRCGAVDVAHAGGDPCALPAAPSRARRYPRRMPAAPAARSGWVRAVFRAGRVLVSLAMGVLLAVLALGLAFDGAFRDLNEDD
jgi:hypothetical protein